MRRSASSKRGKHNRKENKRDGENDRMLRPAKLTSVANSLELLCRREWRRRRECQVPAGTRVVNVVL